MTLHHSSPSDSVSVTALMDYVRELARWEKYSGTADERTSLAYVEEFMQSCGFATHVVEHDAYISLPVSAEVTFGDTSFKSITHSFSRQSPAEGVTAELVYVGSSHDYAGKDVRGKIVLVDGIANPVASYAASRAGALGQLHVSPHEILHEMCVSPVWGNPAPDTLANLPSTVICSILRSDGDRLKAALDVGTVTVTLRNTVDTGWRKTPILIADMASPKGDTDEPYLLFSGHHDTWYFGVMDNGAANATMMEVARLCAKRQPNWVRGLRVAFWSGHSHGRYSGSTWYADNHWQDLEKRCVAHVNVDSTGGLNSLNLEEAESMSVLRPLAAEAIALESGVKIAGRRMARAGDQSFGGIGLPAMFMGFSHQSTGTDTWVVDGQELTFKRGQPGPFGWWWHTPEDTIDKIDPELLARDTRVYVTVLNRLLEQPVLPLDFEAWAAEFLQFVDGLTGELAGRFDLDPLIQRGQRLKQAAQAIAGSAPGLEDRINLALMKASRALLPIEYTTGDRFAHDPALQQPAYPVLKPLVDLAGLPDGDPAHFTKVAATRARNRVVKALDDAIEAIEAVQCD